MWCCLCSLMVKALGLMHLGMVIQAGLHTIPKACFHPLLNLRIGLEACEYYNMSFSCYMAVFVSNFYCSWVLSQYKWGLKVGYAAGVVSGVNRCIGFGNLCR